MFKNVFVTLWRRQRRWLYGLLAFVTAFSLWAGTPQSAQAISWLELIFRGAQVLQLSNISDRQEVAIGSQINQQISQQLARNRTPIVQDPAINYYINQLGRRLAQTSARPDIPYTFQVVDSRDINAFATMGGFVYVNLGLMLLAENEAELASVVGHEIGHIAGRHAIDQMRDRAIRSGILSAAGLDASRAVQIGVQLALELPNSREAELESDQLGLDNLRRSGYAPTAMVTFMQKLQQQGGSSFVPTILSTHPATGDRIRILQRELSANPPAPNQTGGLNSQEYRNTLRQLLS
ncbi:MAG: M48 family metalloprotease [Spirulinaceae cyanobacterium SM2_1_0]|nr:M48 family metalloprotease [Spirulinaceae cyanobacterium SM2_1_0]